MIPRGIQKSHMEGKMNYDKKFNHRKVNQGFKSIMEKEN